MTEVIRVNHVSDAPTSPENGFTKGRHLGAHVLEMLDGTYPLRPISFAQDVEPHKAMHAGFLETINACVPQGEAIEVLRQGLTGNLVRKPQYGVVINNGQFEERLFGWVYNVETPDNVT